MNKEQKNVLKSPLANPHHDNFLLLLRSYI